MGTAWQTALGSRSAHSIYLGVAHAVADQRGLTFGRSLGALALGAAADWAAATAGAAASGGTAAGNAFAGEIPPVSADSGAAGGLAGPDASVAGPEE
jgi:hypothetical protein